MTCGEKLTYWLLTAALWLVALLPLNVLYVISRGLSFLFRRVLHYRRKVIYDNLRSSFPQMSDDQIEQIAREFYLHLADVMVETIKLLHISDRTLDRHIEVVNYELVNQYGADGRPIILFLGHYGNWEWVPDVARFYNQDIANYHVYKPLHDAPADALYERQIRRRFRSIGIPQNSAVRQLIALGRSGERFMVGFIADHRSNSKVSHYRTEFLNHLTPFNPGGEAIGDKIGARYLYLDIEKPSRGHYRMTFRPIQPKTDGEPAPYTRAYMDLLQQTIRRQPPYWLWSHRRWHYK